MDVTRLTTDVVVPLSGSSSCCAAVATAADSLAATAAAVAVTITACGSSFYCSSVATEMMALASAADAAAGANQFQKEAPAFAGASFNFRAAFGKRREKTCFPVRFRVK